MNLPQTLEQHLRTGKIIPFVGAGVPMAVKDRQTHAPLFPSWRQLLERAAKRLDAEQKSNFANLVRALLSIDPADYLEAAQRARQGLGAVWFDLLKENIDPPLENVDHDSLSLAKAIWELGSRLIITTNYDRTLSWSCPQIASLRIWDIEAPAEQAADLREGTQRPTVWHLHGFIDNAAKIILTSADYRLLYPEAGDSQSQYEAAIRTLQSKLSSYSFLFIGFSLDDQHFGAQLKAVNEIYKGMSGPHFVLAREADRARIESLDPSLQVIPFEHFGDPLLQLVRQLGEVARVDQLPQEVAKISPPAEVAVPYVADYGPHHSVFFVPFRQKGDQVIGRERSLQEVRKQLTEGRRTAIGQAVSFEGLGGLGKTQLAVEYAYRFKGEYPNGVIWLNADQDIDAQLTELAESALWVAPESEHKYKLEVAKHRLRTHSDCLIIFDNLETVESIKDYLPEPQATPHILVTSRIDQPSFNPIHIDPLDKDLSLELLVQEAGRKPSGDEEERVVSQIIDELGGLPLALELAGAYLRHRQVSWHQYLNLLNQNPRSVLQGRFPTFTRHEADIYSTLKIDEEIFREEPKLRDILDLLTWSGSAPMGLSLMTSLLAAGADTELTGALGLGLQLRLLQTTSDSDGYLVHRLVSKVRREEIPLQIRSDWVNEICKRIGEWFQELREDFLQLPRFEAELPHLSAWQQQSDIHAPQHAGRLLWLQAFPPFHRGQYWEAKQLTEKALKLFEQKQINDSDLNAHLLDDLGSCLLTVGSYQSAFEYQERALEIRRQVLGEQHPATASSLNNVGTAYGELGDYKKALEYQERALEVRRQVLGEQHPDTASSLGNVGGAYSYLGDYKKALEYQERALEIRRQVLGEQHPDTASSLGNVGGAYSNLGDHKKALEYQERALEIRRQVLGEQHPDTATSLSHVGGAYGELGDHKKALEYHERALEIRRQVLGEQHPDTATSLGNVGTAYSYLGDYKKALEYQERALEIRQQVLGEQHPDTARSLNNVGTAYSNLGDHKKALEYIENVLKMNTELLGIQHPRTIKSAVNLAAILCKAKNPLKAFYLLDNMLKTLPHTHASYTYLKEQHGAVKNRAPGLRHHKQKKKKRS
jgi:tetratricopeptide (TPR) repeat protein